MHATINRARGPVIAMLALLLSPGNAAAGGEAKLTALKLDVLCRGGHDALKLAAHGHWCNGYARALRDALEMNDLLPAGCVPGDNKALWDRFGEWLVATPDGRRTPATRAVLTSLRATCSWSGTFARDPVQRGPDK